MGKKKLWSTVSTMKLEEVLVGNYAGRLGGFVGLDRDEQLALMNMAREKAKYWENKAGFYHRVREAVAGILAGTDVPRYMYPSYYAFGEKVARAYAMYPDAIADAYVNAISTQFGDLEGGILDQIVERAREIGQNARPLYHLQPT
jgi:hypothetical protein